MVKQVHGNPAGGIRRLLLLMSLALAVGALGRAGADSAVGVTVEKVKYKGWPDCIRLSNGQVELIATTVVGPRLIRFGYVGAENEFHEFPDQVGKTGGTDWRSYGGHRLWTSPEAQPRSYEPDNSPIQVTMDGDALHLLQPTEKDTGIRKEMVVTMDPQGTHVRVLHRLSNRGLWPVTLAAWALSVMEKGGRAVIPQSRRSTPGGLLPNRALVLWPYTDMSDSRAFWGKRYILLRQESQATGPMKIGMTGYDGWAGYVRNGHLFLKRFTHQLDAMYPDYGASVESYVASDFLELETVGPLRELQPGQTLEHVEDWYLFQNADAQDEAAVDRTVLPDVQATAAPPR